MRLFFVWQFPATAGDTPIYDQLARNWLDHGVYGMWIEGVLTPVDLRAPGYPAFLALVYSLFGRSFLAVMHAQVAVDVLSCLLTALLAARIAPHDQRRRVFAAALWLAALCPFVANYAAVPLTEVLATFLTTLALFLLVNFYLWFVHSGDEAVRLESPQGPIVLHANWFWMLAGVVVGFGTLVRPEMPLLLASFALVLVFRWRAPANWRRLAATGLSLAAGLLLALAPWAARNWRALHEVQFLAPRYAQLPGELVPYGFNAWTKTWLISFQDVYDVPWKLEEEAIRIEDIPDSAFDSAEERARVAALLDQHNATLQMTPQMDAAFADLARERRARHPVRVWVCIPLARVFTLWLTPRIELLPFSGNVWPLRQKWQEDRTDLLVTLLFGVLNLAVLALGAAGLWRARRRPGVAILVSFIALRTLFLTQLETVEPRYVVVSIPALLALAAQRWSEPS